MQYEVPETGGVPKTSEVQETGEVPAKGDMPETDAAEMEPPTSLPAGFKTPFQQFILKIHERCNLACDYCYIYEMADQSWKTKPRRMSSTVLIQSVHRISEHVKTHNLSEIDIVLHGGEPLIAGADFCQNAARLLRQTMSNVTINIGVQTNGVLLNDRMLEVFREEDITVGVSLDGGAQANDSHRKFANGKGSYAAVEKGLNNLLRDEYRHLFSGLLCAIDIDNDPIETYEALLQFGPPTIDFLLPHANWATPPPKKEQSVSATPYADWLIEIFDHWRSAPAEQSTNIRMFNEIIAMLLGVPSMIETIGLSPIGLVVIETDGSFEQVDTLKSAFEGAADTGMSVSDNSLDDVLNLPEIQVRQAGLSGLCETCRECSAVRVCGGGYYTHRYSETNGFNNPSVYCDDLFKLINYISAELTSTLLTSSASKNA